MKLINTLALIAGAMVITTEAVKLSTDKGKNERSRAERFVDSFFKENDTNNDGKLIPRTFTPYV